MLIPRAEIVFMTILRLVPAPGKSTAPGAPRGERSRRITRKSEQTRNLILEAAVDCLNTYGFHGTNLSRVAEMAGVTRGCLQYYYMTTVDIAVALGRHIAQQQWERYEAEALHPPHGRALIEFAIDMVANARGDRYRVARLELLTAARTLPALQPVLAEAAELVETQAKQFTARLFGNAALADTPQFRAARDLTALVNDWLFVHVFPDSRDERIQAVIEALRIALHTLWRIPSLDAGLDVGKPRVRALAGSRPSLAAAQGEPGGIE